MTTELEHPGSEAFHNRIHDNHMYGLWELASQMTAHPTPKMIPYMWKWELFESVLARVSRFLPFLPSLSPGRHCPCVQTR